MRLGSACPASGPAGSFPLMPPTSSSPSGKPRRCRRRRRSRDSPPSWRRLRTSQVRWASTGATQAPRTTPSSSSPPPRDTRSPRGSCSGPVSGAGQFGERKMACRAAVTASGVRSGFSPLSAAADRMSARVSVATMSCASAFLSQIERRPIVATNPTSSSAQMSTCTNLPASQVLFPFARFVLARFKASTSPSRRNNAKYRR
jgi:hypothetical protein